MSWWDLLIIGVLVFLAAYAAALSLLIQIELRLRQVVEEEDEE